MQSLRFRAMNTSVLLALESEGASDQGLRRTREFVEACERRFSRFLPDSELSTDDHITMGAEDMAFMQEKVPGCYFFVGSNNAARRLDYGHHHPKFDFDEAALPRAAGLMAAAAAELLRPA